MPQRALAWDEPEVLAHDLAARLRERTGRPTQQDIADMERIAEQWSLARETFELIATSARGSTVCRTAQEQMVRSQATAPLRRAKLLTKRD